MNIKNNITRNLLNIPGWRTKRRLVVIESDDWGTIRMSSGKAYNRFMQQHIPVNTCPYNTHDTLESNSDLEMLFQVLSSVKDSNGNPAILTANNIVANPDFEKIKAADFEAYFFEPFTTTLTRYPEHDRVMELYQEGISRKLVRPQFHGREHVNTERWLRSLQQDDKLIHMAFEEGMFSFHAESNRVEKNEWMDALDGDSAAALQNKIPILQTGLQLFRDIWGFSSQSFIAPCYIWHRSVEAPLAAAGVQYLQGMVIQQEPLPQEGYQYKKVYHYQGQKNAHGQRYLIRNVFFEPCVNPSFDWVNDCMHRVEVAFRWHKPAIISTHRVNFMGSLHPQNRAHNLALLSQLLKSILKKWPDAEFVSSDALGDIITKGSS